MTQESSEYAQLAARIEKLPQELKNEIEGWVYMLGLSGGFLHFRGGSKYYEGCKKLPTPNMQLLTVDKHVAAKYADRIWSENTLVIDVGKYLTIIHLPLTRSILHRTAPSFCPDLVRKVLVRFSSRQLHLQVGAPWRPKPATDVDETAYDWSDDFAFTFQESARVAHKILGRLPSLEHVILDFTECYGLDGRFYGCLAAWGIYGFRRNDCQKLDIEVLAPCPQKRDHILRNIVGDGFADNEG
ncbi:MAG: hypothetical protein Q9208_008807 [Pyrenodesmia sp. 3 TL-2023]